MDDGILFHLKIFPLKLKTIFFVPNCKRKGERERNVDK
jgi:hypothetical protein